MSADATYEWWLSWRGTYGTFRTQIASGAESTVRVNVGGHRLTVHADHHGIRHVATTSARITGTNPSAADVAKAIGPDDVLEALCWKESTWHQFNAAGQPLLPPRTKRNEQPAARGIGQIVEYVWGKPSDKISHNDYAQMAWQWDYCIEAARDILVYYGSLVKERKPDALGIDYLAWLFACYNHGPSTLARRAVPTGDAYVKACLGFMAEKPWEAFIR